MVTSYQSDICGYSFYLEKHSEAQTSTKQLIFQHFVPYIQNANPEHPKNIR